VTRINCIPPAELSDKHLVAEYRELPRVFGLVARAALRGERPDDPRNPTEYTLGKGHVRFFYPRLGYCHTRFTQIVHEMRLRGMHPKFDAVPGLAHMPPDGFFQQWEPTPQAQALNRQRIADNTRAAKVRQLLKGLA
jgi:hypothetical protein